MQRLAALLLAVFFCAVFAAPTIRIGRSTAKLGSLAANAYPQEETMHWWANWTNSNGGINVGGVAYNVALVEYNDASDPVLVSILYQYMVEVDQVDALFSPFNSVLTLNALKYLNKTNAKVPMVFAGGGANTLFGVYQNAFGTIPPANTHALTCLRFLSGIAKNISIVYQAGDFFQTLQYNVVSGAAPANNLTVVGNLSFVTGTKDWTSIVQQLKAINADILYLCMFTGDIITFMPELKKAGVYPAATWFTSATFPILAKSVLATQGLAWTIDQYVSQTWWIPTLSYTSNIGFYNSTVWKDGFDSYMKAGNLSVISDDLTSAAFAAGMVLADGITRAGSLDPSAVSAAIRTTNLELYYGPVTFNALGQVALPPICTQYINGTLQTIAPAEVASRAIVYPSTVRAPKGFYDLPKKKDSHNTRNILIIVGCILAFLIIVAAITYLILRKNYHLIFIPKEGTGGGDEWGTDGTN